MVLIDFSLLNFIVQNFAQSNIISAVLFTCWNVETQYAFTQMATVKFMYTQYVHIDRPDALQNFQHRYFMHNHPTLGIFLDLNCEKSTEFLNMSSKARLYNEHYHWLIYDEAANFTHFRQLFEHANLSLDTDMTYALKDEGSLNTKSNGLRLILYDVYNNGYHIGGKLNMTLDREILCNESSCQLHRYLSDLHTRPKYRQRSYLPDVSWRIATVVYNELRLRISKIYESFESANYRIIHFTSPRSVCNLSPPRSHRDTFMGYMEDHMNIYCFQCAICKKDVPKEQIKRHLLSVNRTEVDGIARYSYALLMVLQEMLGFNMSPRYFDRWTNGEVFGGAIEEVALERVEMVSTPLLITKGRFVYLTAVAETGLFRSICMFRTPHNTGIQGDVFLQPFDMTVWWIFGALLIMAALLLWRTFYIEHYRIRRFHDGYEYVPSLLSTFLIAFGSACSQGSNLIPQSAGGRIAFFSLTLITFFMYNYYTSVVVSLLLGSPIKSNIKTVGQLADSSLDVGLDPLPYTKTYLNFSKLPEVRRLVQRKITSKRVWITAEEGIRRVRDNPGFVFIFEASTGYALVERLYKPHEICDLNEILFRPETKLQSLLHKNSTYKEIVRLKQLRMFETGIILKHQHFWVRSKLTCYDSNYLLEVGLEYTAPLFFLLLCAYILVLLILGTEFAWKRYADRKEQQREMLVTFE